MNGLNDFLNCNVQSVLLSNANIYTNFVKKTHFFSFYVLFPFVFFIFVLLSNHYLVSIKLDYFIRNSIIISSSN